MRRRCYVMLDAATQANLELVESRGARNTSLLAALDRTVTPMGGRKLRSWILQPLRDLHELECRQQMIADLLHEPDLLARAAESLKSIRDLERAAGRLSQASGNARDLVALKVSLQQIPELKRELQKLIERIGIRQGTGRRERDVSLGASLQNRLQEMPELTGTTGDSTGRRSANCFEGWRNFPRWIRSRISTNCGTRSREGKNWIAAIAGTRDRRDRHQIAQGPVQFRVRLFHRNHEIEPRERAGRITRASKRRSAANASSRRS